MTRKTKFQYIKNFIKISVATGLVVLFIVLTFFVKHTHTFENSNMAKWTSLSDIQQINTIKRISPDFNKDDLFMKCMEKIAALPESDNMIIQSAISLCYNGIKLNNVLNEQE